MPRRGRSSKRVDAGFGAEPRSGVSAQSSWVGQSTDNNAGAYGVRIQDAKGDSVGAYWRAIVVHHLDAEENQGRSQIMVQAVDEHGQLLSGVRVCVRSAAEDVALTLAEAESPPAACVMSEGQSYCVEVCGSAEEPACSECVCNLHSDHPDEAAGNARFHHSFVVVFQRMLPRMPEAIETTSSDESELVGHAPDVEDAAPNRAIAEYLLFGEPGALDTRTSMLLAVDYILARRPAFGFSPQEAGMAAEVVIVGDTNAVSSEVEAGLLSSGCRVQRVCGDSFAVEQLLAERLRAHAL